MARPRALDILQSYSFWVFDASGTQGNPLFSVFDPVLGFSAVTAPEIQVELQEIRPGNWEYARRVVKHASVQPILLSRGVRFFDSDFYNWISNAIRGVQPVRRNLVIVHFMGFRPIRQLVNAVAAGDGAPTSARVGPETGITSLVERLPGRAWILHGCVPTRYKAGSDFDATNGNVSIAELEVSPEYIEEMTVSTLSPLGARALSLGIAVGTTVDGVA